MGNWSLTCLKEGEIAIHNSDGQQATILKEDLPGFVFESNRGTKHSFTAETSLGEEPSLDPGTWSLGSRSTSDSRGTRLLLASGVQNVARHWSRKLSEEVGAGAAFF